MRRRSCRFALDQHTE